MIEHPKGRVGVKTCGFVLHAPLSKDLDEATLSYRFKFEKDYDWTFGGKCASQLWLAFNEFCSNMPQVP